MPPRNPVRRPTQPLGRRGEALAAAYLAARGLRIVERNCRSRLGEIDLIARDGPTLVFVEVKAREGTTGDPPQAAVGARKQARLGRVAQGYLHRWRLGEPACRFDVVAVILDRAGGPPAVQYFPDAFQLDGSAG